MNPFADLPDLDEKKSPNPFADLPDAAPSTAHALAAARPGLARGLLANLPGAPMDTLLNMADLSRAATGFIGGHLGLMSADQLPELINRENVPFSSAWNVKRIQDSGRSKLIDNPYPGDSLARVAYAGGQTAPMAMLSGGNPATLLRNMAGAATAGAAGQTAAEVGGGPEAQLLASFAAPAAGMKAASMGLAAQERVAQAKITNQVRDESIRQAKAAGLSIPPMEATPEAPGFINRAVTQIGQKIATEQQASAENVGTCVTVELPLRAAALQAA